MKKTFFLKMIMLSSLLLAGHLSVKAQFIEDALRFTSPNSAFSARVGALGHSFFGLSDDASALMTNPAGLTLIPLGEIGFGLNFTHNPTTTTFLNNTKQDSKNEFYCTNVQFIFPNLDFNGNNSETDDESIIKNLKFGFSYNLENDFAVNTRYSGYNVNNTLIAQQADMKANWTVITNVADSSYKTNIQNNIQQDGYIYEKGGLHNFAFGTGFDFSRYFSAGATFIFKFGTYNYTKAYYETDILNVHNTYPTDDINKLQVRDNLIQELFGISGIIGAQARFSNLFRLGLAIKFPTLLVDSEYFKTTYEVEFDPHPTNGHIDTRKYSDGSFVQKYSIITPFEFSLGLSGNIKGLSYSLSTSLQDLSTACFRNSIDTMSYTDLRYLEYLNEMIESNLKIQYTFGAGLEYKIPRTPLYLRGSYTVITSPYVIKQIASNKTIIGAGLGLMITPQFIIDASFVHSNFTTERANYGNMDKPAFFSNYETKYAPNNFIVGIRYRY